MELGVVIIDHIVCGVVAPPLASDTDTFLASNCADRVIIPVVYTTAAVLVLHSPKRRHSSNFAKLHIVCGRVDPPAVSQTPGQQYQMNGGHSFEAHSVLRFLGQWSRNNVIISSQIIVSMEKKENAGQNSFVMVSWPAILFPQTHNRADKCSFEHISLDFS
jgi:hypothetical protein